MNEKCEEIMDKYLMLDRNRMIPPRMTLHLLRCKECRTEVRMLTKAQRLCAEPLLQKIAPEDRSIRAVMDRLFPQKDRSPITLTNWIISGALMILLLLVFVFLPHGSGLLTLAFYMLFAAIITTYVALFVGCNMDFFVKKIDPFKDIDTLRLA